MKLKFLCLCFLVLTAVAGAQDSYIKVEPSNVRFNQMISLKPTSLTLEGTVTTETLVNVRGYNSVVLNSSKDLTGIKFVGGSSNQILYVRSGDATTNTLRLDDCTSLTLGSNITITGGNNDTVGLWCIDSKRQIWTRLFNSSN